MANITISTPTEHDQRIIDAFAAVYGWTSESGVTKAQFVKQQIVRFIKDTVRSYERRVAQEAATVNVTDVDAT